MRCPIESRENLELLLDYGSSKGKATGTLAIAFREHLGSCAACREAVDDQQEVRAALDIWEAPEISVAFNRQLYRRIEEPVKWNERLRAVFSGSPRELLLWRGVPVAATAGLVFMAMTLFRQPEPAKPLENVAVEAAQPEQVVHALDDMEMLDAFIQSVPPPGKSQL
jgi:hypothetical protein